MGAWGTGIFENDAACDWTFELEASNDFSAIEQALDDVLETGPGYLESDVASRALAACDVLVRLKRAQPDTKATQTVEAWVAGHPLHPTTEQLRRAVAAIDRVLADPSELLELWAESPDASSWRQSVVELRARTADGAPLALKS